MRLKINNMRFNFKILTIVVSGSELNLIELSLWLITSKKGGQVGITLMSSRLQVGHCIMDGVTFKFNDVLSLYKKNGSERSQSVSVSGQPMVLLSIIN